MKLFMVESPLQLINAIEAQQHFGVSPAQSLLLVLEGVSALNQRQTLSLIRESDWSEVKSIGSAQSLMSFLSARIFLHRWLHGRYESIDEVIIGDFRSRFMRHVANTLKQPVVLLDDGTATLAVADRRRQNVTPDAKYERGWRRYLNKRRLFGYRDHDIPALTFFSTFNFQVPDQDRIVKHHYGALRKCMSACKRQPVRYFIGCPLVEMGIVSARHYQGYLEKIAQDFKETICYIPHRREDAQRVQELAKSLKWQVKSFDKPIELVLLEKGELPLGLIGLYSTALDNAHTLFGEQLPIHSYEIPVEDILKSERKVFTKRVYTYYRHHYLSDHFQIVNL